MKTLIVAVAAVALFVGFSSMSLAEKPAKEVTLKGTFACGKCELKEAPKCQNVLIVGEGDDKVTYWLTPNKVSKDNHKHVCQSTVEGVTVVGKVHEESGKHMLTATSIMLPDKG